MDGIRIFVLNILMEVTKLHAVSSNGGGVHNFMEVFTISILILFLLHFLYDREGKPLKKKHSNK